MFAHRPPLTFLSCFQAPCGQIWACEYSILGFMHALNHNLNLSWEELVIAEAPSGFISSLPALCSVWLCTTVWGMVVLWGWRPGLTCCLTSWYSDLSWYKWGMMVLAATCQQYNYTSPPPPPPCLLLTETMIADVDIACVGRWIKIWGSQDEKFPGWVLIILLWPAGPVLLSLLTAQSYG